MWMSGLPPRYFLVPADAGWVEGEATARDILGKKRPVDLAWLAGFEVTPEEARAFGEAETARLRAKLTGKRPDGRKIAEELLAGMRRLDAEAVRRFMREAKLEVPGRDADADAAFIADLVRTISSNLAPEARAGLGPKVQEVLRRHGRQPDAEALRRLPAEIARLRAALQPRSPVPEAPPVSRAPNQSAEQARAVRERARRALDLARAELTPDQVRSVESFLEEGEPRLALEMLVQYVDTNEGWLDGPAVEAVGALLRELGSDRADVEYLRRPSG